MRPYKFLNKAKTLYLTQKQAVRFAKKRWREPKQPLFLQVSFPVARKYFVLRDIPSCPLSWTRAALKIDRSDDKHRDSELQYTLTLAQPLSTQSSQKNMRP